MVSLLLRAAALVNYHHLLYFWTVARSGSVVAAARKLRLSPPTVSAQIRSLEQTFGQRLFERSGRGVALTDAGRVALKYADLIFDLGAELEATLHAEHAPRRIRLGLEDTLAGGVVRRLLAPVLTRADAPTALCVDGRHTELFTALAAHELDLVLAAAPPAPGECRGVRHTQVFESDVALFAAPSLARHLRHGFPASLDGAPVLLSHEGSALRAEVEQWFARVRVRPRVVAELTDRDVIEALGADGVGIFAAPTALRSDLVSGRGVEELGVLSHVHERVFAVGAARAFEHPAVAELLRWQPGVSALTDNDVTLARFAALTPTGT